MRLMPGFRGAGAVRGFRRTAHLLFNVVAFDLGWFASVLGAARGRPWAGPAVVALLAAAHLALTERRRREAAVLGTACAVGLAVDTVFIRLGVCMPVRDVVPEPFAPLWMVFLWLNFATTLNVSLRVLKGRPLLAGLLGAVAGPLAYWSGARLGAIALGDPVSRTLLVIAAGYAVATPLLVWLAGPARGLAEVSGGNAPGAS